MKHFLNKIRRWMVDRFIHIPERDRYLITWLITFGMATTALAVIQAIGNPIGASLTSHMINIGKTVAINGLLFITWTFVIGALLSFIYLPLPRLFLASYSYTMISTVFLLLNENGGKLFSYMIGLGYSIVVMFIGLFFIVLLHRKVRGIIKIIMLTMIVGLCSIYLLFNKVEIKQDAVTAIAEYTEPITDENPAQKGSYNYSFFTYGSGQDVHREEFGKDVDQITPTVDASHFITKWGKDREAFWKFGPSQLPINGRVWFPEGQGSFPIILMVHGNHTMEYFSTSGYDYLGELLASRGFIAISVDEDFINYSNAYGIPNDNYKLRAWILLQHLVHLQQMNETPQNPFYQKIDFDQVALVGHSRGGQAALMATDYTTFFDDDELLKNMESVNIKGVVAIAPTDKTINGKKPNIHNTSYLLIHGARDADVYDFRGDQQFYRTTFDAYYDGFKATLYIADANHTQFNTSWGRMDLSLPRGLFLNQKQTMDPDDQQQIAKVYLSAFFESIFHGKTSYEKLFQDYRYGKEWLPDTTLVSKYQHATYQPIMTFNQRNEEIIDVHGFTKWEVTTPKNRRGNNRLQDALRLEWKENALYSIDITSKDLRRSERIILTMANVNGDAGNENVPKIEIELETTDGVSVQMPLDDFMPFPPVIKTDYTHFGLFDDLFRDGKYNRSWEPIFQTFEIPIEIFEKTDPKFDREKINKMTLHFKNHPGKILIEEIGVW